MAAKRMGCSFSTQALNSGSKSTSIGVQLQTIFNVFESRLSEEGILLSLYITGQVEVSQNTGLQTSDQGEE